VTIGKEVCADRVFTTESAENAERKRVKGRLLRKRIEISDKGQLSSLCTHYTVLRLTAREQGGPACHRQ
jgi:hypothetical protein